MNKFRFYLNRIIMVILVTTALQSELSILLSIAIMLVVGLQLIADVSFKERVRHGY